MDLSAASWRKSSYSTGGGQNCVEVAVLPGAVASGAVASGAVAIRDSKDPGGPAHVFGAAAFRDLVARIQCGELDL